MEIVSVQNRVQERKFIELPIKLYQNEKTWIRPLDKDILKVFDRKSNKNFSDGDCQRWILLNDKKPIGRIAAFYNKKTINKDNDQPTGGVGFFECINNQKAANLLFDTAKEWLKGYGIEAMDGPVNFGDRNAWWGLLVEGYDIEPNYQCNFNPPYYQKLFEDYGFRVYFKQFTFGRLVLAPLDQSVYDKAEKVFKDSDYSFSHIKVKESDKYAEVFRHVYNKAWAGHSGVAEMSSKQAQNVMKQLKPIMDEKLIWFGFYKDEPVALFVNLPEMNQVFKKVNGKLDLIGKLKFLWHYKVIKSNRKLMGLVFGVVPEHQKKGVEAALILKFRKLIQEDYRRYEDFEMNWIGDFNPKMINVAKKIGGEIIKTHHTYRYLFDRNKEFKRMPLKG